MKLNLFCTLFLLCIAAASISALPVSFLDFSPLRREVDDLFAKDQKSYGTVKRAAGLELWRPRDSYGTVKRAAGLELWRPRVKRLDSDMAQMGGWQMAGGIWG